MLNSLFLPFLCALKFKSLSESNNNKNPPGNWYLTVAAALQQERHTPADKQVKWSFIAVAAVVVDAGQLAIVCLSSEMRLNSSLNGCRQKKLGRV